jgi:hypothetical protein
MTTPTFDNRFVEGINGMGRKKLEALKLILQAEDNSSEANEKFSSALLRLVSRLILLSKENPNQFEAMMNKLNSLFPNFRGTYNSILKTYRKTIREGEDIQSAVDRGLQDLLEYSNRAVGQFNDSRMVSTEEAIDFLNDALNAEI